MQPPIPPDERERLEELRCYQILDTAAEPAYDDLVYVASQICQTPIALVSLIDSQRQFLKSRLGMHSSETPRDQAFCAMRSCSPRRWSSQMPPLTGAS